MKRAVFLISIVFALLAVSIAAAQSGGGYDLTWNSIDAGGMMFSTGGGYTLGGTIGQPDAGALSGGNYRLSGGFWNDAEGVSGYRVYLPVVLH